PAETPALSLPCKIPAVPTFQPADSAPHLTGPQCSVSSEDPGRETEYRATLSSALQNGHTPPHSVPIPAPHTAMTESDS
ncbi:hypothetical protein, partial [Proteus mirabilis]|uniref:hypothetical protein n=1 Tax=Proteus mirabilis TaxID=584 RepID=UPI003B008510